MDTTGTPPAPPHRRHLQKRILIPAALAVVLAVVLVAAFVRGTWADTAPKDPATAANGIHHQLYQAPDGRKQIRCAVILDYPVEEVWATVTDYGQYAAIFPTLESARAEDTADGGHHLTGAARSLLGTFPFDVVFHNEEEPGKKYVGSWEGGSGAVRVLRGSWTVTPAGQGQTLLVFSSEAEVAGYPNWVVRNVLLSRQPRVVAAVGEHLRQKHAP
jgi:carbon monoxide dehydrogenase subunit G